MKYLKEEPLRDRRGNEVKVQLDNEEKLLTPGLFIYLMAESYTPSPQILVLNNGDRRRLDKIEDQLDGEPNSKGCFEFEDTDWLLIKKIFDVWVPYVPFLSKHSSHMEDALTEAKDKLE